MTSPSKSRNIVWNLYPVFEGIMVVQYKDQGTSVNRR